MILGSKSSSASWLFTDIGCEDNAGELEAAAGEDPRAPRAGRAVHPGGPRAVEGPGAVAGLRVADPRVALGARHGGARAYKTVQM